MSKRSVDVVQRELDEARECAKRLAEELHELKMEAAGVRPGVVVRAKYRGQMVEAKVTRVETGWHDKPWLKGVLRKKDGDWAAGERHLYSDWEHVAD